MMLPKTTPNHYITGITALNIPSPEKNSGDWHFFESFYGRNERVAKIMLAGEGEAINTNTILGDLGIYECSSTLKEAGIPLPEPEKIYAANHYRAILDLLYHSVKDDYYPYHIDIQDWLDTIEQHSAFFKMLTLFKKKLTGTQQKLLEQWQESQT